MTTVNRDYDLLPTASIQHEDELNDVECNSNETSDIASGIESSSDEIVKREESLCINEDTPYLQRMMILFEHSAPVSLSFVISIATTFITQYFAGHFEMEGNQTIVFAGVALSVMFYNVSCRSLLIGLTSAVDTLASQHNGAQNYREVGIVLQRCCAILSVFCVPLLPMWLLSDSLFSLLGIDKEVCYVIGVFTRIRLFALPADIVNESYEKYLMAIGEMAIPMYANIIIGIVILALNVLFINVFHWSWEALSWTVVISEYAGMATMVGLSLYCTSVQRTLQPWSRECLTEWKEFVWLAMPGVGMLCSEWWAFEFLTIFASLVSTEAVAAQAVIMQLSTLAFMFPLGIAVTGTSFIGNTLGAEKTHLAMDITKLGFTATLLLEVFVSGSILLFGPAFVRLFALDEEVRGIAYSVVPYLAMFTISDSIQCFASGVLRAAGKQHIGAIVNIGTYYSVGLPLAWFLCFHSSFGVRGLMLGISSAVIIQTCILLTIIFCYADSLYVVEKSVLEASRRHHQLGDLSSSGSNHDEGGEGDSCRFVGGGTSNGGETSAGAGSGKDSRYSRLAAPEDAHGSDSDNEFVDIEMSPIQPLQLSPQQENRANIVNAHDGIRSNRSSNGVAVDKGQDKAKAAEGASNGLARAVSTVASARNPLRQLDQ